MILDRKRDTDTLRKSYRNIKMSSVEGISDWWDFEKNDMSIDMVSVGSPRKFFFKCPKGHSFKKEARGFAEKCGNCPQCREDRRERTEVDKELLINNGIEEPDFDFVYPYKKAEWICTVCGQTLFERYRSLLRNLKERGSPCPVCSQKKGYLVRGVNDFATTHPDLAKDVISPDPTTFTSRSSEKVMWQCRDVKDHVYETPPYRRAYKDRSCKICAVANGVRRKRERIAKDHPIPKKVKDLIVDSDCDLNLLSAGSCRNFITVKYPDCGHERVTSPMNIVNQPECTTCLKGKPTSEPEQEISQIIKNVIGEDRVLERDRRTLGNKEIDILVPDLGIGFEYNGLYWHSEPRKRPGDHYEKWKLAKEKGIQLIVIWEDDWKFKRTIVESLIKHKLGVSDKDRVYARETTVKKLPYADTEEFLNLNHIQGSSTGSSYLGLFDKGGALVAAMVLKKSNDSLEISRFATSKVVVGGFSKLLKAAKEIALKDGFSSLISFSDHEVSNGGIYEMSGFVADKELSPDYKYLFGGRRCHKFGFRKDRFKSRPDLKYAEGLTERELAELNGLERIWDYGKTRWVLNL